MSEYTEIEVFITWSLCSNIPINSISEYNIVVDRARLISQGYFINIWIKSGGIQTEGYVSIPTHRYLKHESGEV